MFWNENLYALYRQEGGTFLGRRSDGWGEEDCPPDALLLLEHRGHPLVVCGTYEVHPAGQATSATLWTRVVLQAKLDRPVELELKSESLLDKGLGLLETLGKKEDDLSWDWHPEGYTVTCEAEVFAKGVLASQPLRRALQAARKKDPVKLPLRLRVTPLDGESGLHTVETATRRFAGQWSSLGMNLLTTPEETARLSLELLQRLLDTGKLWFDAVSDVRLL